MEAGSSFGEIDNILIFRLLKIIRCKNGCHLFPRKIAKFQIGGQKEDKNLERNRLIANFVKRIINC